MSNLQLTIERPRPQDQGRIEAFFDAVLLDTFQQNGIAHLIAERQQEMAEKRHFLAHDLTTGGTQWYFLIAKVGEKVVGTIQYGPSNALINTCTGDALKDVVEIGTVFVGPEYQGQGVGRLMMASILKVLEEKGIREFCLDSGYPLAQAHWCKQLGEPQYHLVDYWGPGADHMIWHIALSGR